MTGMLQNIAQRHGLAYTYGSDLAGVLTGGSKILVPAIKPAQTGSIDVYVVMSLGQMEENFARAALRYNGFKESDYDVQIDEIRRRDGITPLGATIMNTDMLNSLGIRVLPYEFAGYLDQENTIPYAIYRKASTLDEQIKGLSCKERLDVAIQAAEFLQKLHKSGWVWNDLKPENFMRDPETGIVLPYDFDTLRRTDERSWGTPSTYPYGSFCQPSDGSQKANDLHAFGIFLGGNLLLNLTQEELREVAIKNSYQQSLNGVDAVDSKEIKYLQHSLIYFNQGGQVEIEVDRRGIDEVARIDQRKLSVVTLFGFGGGDSYLSDGYNYMDAVVKALGLKLESPEFALPNDRFMLKERVKNNGGIPDYLKYLSTVIEAAGTDRNSPELMFVSASLGAMRRIFVPYPYLPSDIGVMLSLLYTAREEMSRLESLAK